MAAEAMRTSVTDTATFVFHGSPADFPDWLDFGDGWREWFAERWEKMPPIEVHVFPRAAYSAEWFAEWFGEHDGPVPDRYAFRGFFNPKTFRIVLLCDESETGESFAWLLIHELTHAALEHARFLRYVFAYERDALGITVEQEAAAGTDDTLHEQLPEEQFCNRSATLAMGGANLNRTWWRERVNRYLAAQSARESAA